MAEPFTDDAHVLLKEKTGETSLRLRLLTQRHGLIDARAKGVLAPRHPWGRVLDLYRTVEITATFVPGTAICYLRDARAVRYHPAIASDARKLHCIAYAARLAAGALYPLEPCPALFELFEKFQNYIAANLVEPRVINRFERRLLLIMGYECPTTEAEKIRLLAEHCRIEPVVRQKLLKSLTQAS